MAVERIGEVLAASTAAFTAACDDLHQPPPFGSLVFASDGENDVLGLVYSVSTGSIDPGRPALVRGRGLDSEEEVYRQHPQLAALLRTDIEALVVGYVRDGVVRQHLPPRPPRIHAFLYAADSSLVSAFFERLDFLSLVIGAKIATPAEELVAAVLRQAVALAPPAERRQLTVRAGKELVVLLGGDPVRVGAILQRLRA